VVFRVWKRLGIRSDHGADAATVIAADCFFQNPEWAAIVLLLITAVAQPIGYRYCNTKVCIDTIVQFAYAAGSGSIKVLTCMFEAA